MSPAVARLIRRLAAVAVGATAVNESQALVPDAVQDNPNDGHATVIRREQLRTKLIFGRARRGHPLLASHSSHSSHSSHASHYSGSSGGTYGSGGSTTGSGSSSGSGSTNGPSKPSGPTTMKPAPGSSATETTDDRVLRKLPRIRSHWPKEALLTKTSQFSLMDGDRAVGVVTLNSGTTVKIVQIKVEHVVIRIGANEAPVPVSNTDLVERMGGAEKILSYPDDSAPDKPEK